MLPLGTRCPDFDLPSAVDGRQVRRDDLRDAPALLVMFLCNHCPYVIHVREGITALAHEYLDRGVVVVAINSNSEQTHPQDGPEHMKALAEGQGWRFPFLFDRTQQAARDFRAACTPDFFVFDREGRLAYRGQADDARPGKDVPVTGRDLRAALDAVLAGRAPDPDQRPSIGCNIKWHPGHAPEYSGAR
jgi:peroxiredoxin